MTNSRWRAWLSLCLPTHLSSKTICKIARIRYAPFKNRLITWFIRRFAVDLSDAAEQNIEGFEHFNAFFTRALAKHARPLPDELDSLVSPVDGRISQIGPLDEDQLLQAKGVTYSLRNLLGAHRWRGFLGGAFATLYLAPHDYHRIHMPIKGRLVHMTHIPGRLLPVNEPAVAGIAGLFTRNERVVCWFDTERGEMALVMVGALNVGSIETVWAGEITPRSRSGLSEWSYAEQSEPSLDRGDELGRFNLGSTVIVLFPPQGPDWAPGAEPGRAVRMGEILGNWRGGST